MIQSAHSFSEIGRKDNQEDRVYPIPSSVGPDQHYFILCDGMGGHSHGEVASETVSRAFGHYFDTHPVDVATEAYFKEALEYAYAQLDAVDDGAEKKMGTTLTCLFFNPDGYLAAHIGDSRIYQFRHGEIVFRTEDHSLANDLIKAGELTPEEAVNFPRKNVITRAMQPNSRRCKADIHISNDIQPGDCFFMCCDGVLERADEETLVRVMSSNASPEKKISAIKSECDKGTKDNYTSWLISVGAESAVTSESSKKKSQALHAGLICLAVLLLGLFMGRTLSSRRSDDKALRTEIDSLKTVIHGLERSNKTLLDENQDLREKNASLSSKLDTVKSIVNI